MYVVKIEEKNNKKCHTNFHEVQRHLAKLQQY